MILSAENLVTVATRRLESGPVLAGTLEAETSATVRAEVMGTVTAALVEEGERVSRGQILARIDAAALRDALLSAESAVRSAQQQLEVARRDADRAAALLRAGAVAEKQVEAARWNAAQAEAALADAGARRALATEQVAKTEARAPFAGVVSRRFASAGDTVQPGADLYAIVDPTRLRLAATVPAERLGELRPGVGVTFEVTGYPGETFTGAIDRVNPVADAATRQVGLYVTLPNPGGRLVAGLFAEGRVLTHARDALALPLGAVDETGLAPAVTRVREGRVERVDVQLGLRDERLEMVEVRSGLAAGDLVVTGAARGLAPGTTVEIRGGGAE
jgi:RND family efflux transporter MFP subunit